MIELQNPEKNDLAPFFNSGDDYVETSLGISKCNFTFT